MGGQDPIALAGVGVNDILRAGRRSDELPRDPAQEEGDNQDGSDLTVARRRETCRAKRRVEGSVTGAYMRRFDPIVTGGFSAPGSSDITAALGSQVPPVTCSQRVGSNAVLEAHIRSRAHSDGSGHWGRHLYADIGLG